MNHLSEWPRVGITRNFSGFVFFDRFHFVDPGALVDGDFELIAPDAEHIDEVLAACTHPLTQLEAPAEAQITREQLLQFITTAPRGASRLIP